MIWKNFVGPLAITSRRRVLASALVYGLSLTVRFTSTTGEETESSAQSAQRTNPMTSIMTKDSAQIFHRDWDSKFAQPIGFHRGWLLGFRGSRPGCECSMPMSSIPGCSSYP
jgi:hypothetical protein